MLRLEIQKHEQPNRTRERQPALDEQRPAEAESKQAAYIGWRTSAYGPVCLSVAPFS